MSYASKVKSIQALPCYVGSATPLPTFSQTADNMKYKAHTLVNGKQTELLVVIGVVSFVQFTPKEVALTIDVVSKFMTEEVAKPWMTVLTELSHKSPIGFPEDFFEPCRKDKMRFLNRPTDTILVGDLDVTNLKGKAIDGSSINKGDLVAVDFALQVYSSEMNSKKTEGARLVLASVQLLEASYDDSFDRKLELPETPPKRRKT
jgi:hypothetical protein